MQKISEKECSSIAEDAGSIIQDRFSSMGYEGLEFFYEPHFGSFQLFVVHDCFLQEIGTMEAQAIIWEELQNHMTSVRYLKICAIYPLTKNEYDQWDSLEGYSSFLGI